MKNLIDFNKALENRDTIRFLLTEIRNSFGIEREIMESEPVIKLTIHHMKQIIEGKETIDNDMVTRLKPLYEILYIAILKLMSDEAEKLRNKAALDLLSQNGGSK